MFPSVSGAVVDPAPLPPESPGAPPAAELSTEHLEAEIVGLAAHLASAMCRWLLLVAEFDRRGAAEAWECTTTAQWLSWRCAVAPATAREHVRVARALGELPLVREAFASGALSYSKVRAIVRAATPATERELVDLAQVATAAQLERLVNLYGKAVEAAISDEVLEAREARRGVDRYVDERGMHVYVVRLPPEEGLVVDKALEAAGDARYRERRREAKAVGGEDARPERVPVAEARADALMRVVELGRLATLAPDTELREQYVVTLHVKPDEVRVGDDGSYELGNGVRLHPKLARRLGCDALVQLAIEGGEAEGDAPSSLNRGRTVRLATRDQRREILSRHDTCVFPACRAPASWCQVHHLWDWIDGGPTDMDNLVPLCRRHHGALHTRGWRLVRDPFGRFDAIGPDGRYMWAGPPPASGDAGDAVAMLAGRGGLDGGDVGPCAGRRGERFDYADAVTALMSHVDALRDCARQRC
jgi:hypothetical protein